MSDFTNVLDSGVQFVASGTEEATGFSDILDISAPLISFELDEGVDFVPTGDGGVIVVTGTGFGEGGFGEGPFGGSISYTLTFPTTEWRNIDTP